MIVSSTLLSCETPLCHFVHWLRYLFDVWRLWWSQCGGSAVMATNIDGHTIVIDGHSNCGHKKWRPQQLWPQIMMATKHVALCIASSCPPKNPTHHFSSHHCHSLWLGTCELAVCIQIESWIESSVTIWIQIESWIGRICPKTLHDGPTEYEANRTFSN